MFLCQCVTYVHFRFYLQRLFPSKPNAEGSGKMGGAIFVFLFPMDFLFVCFVYVFFLPSMDACGGKRNEVNEGIGFHMFLMIFCYQ